MGLWEFRVQEINELSTRGTVAFGSMTGDLTAVNGPAEVFDGSTTHRLERVTREYARRSGQEVLVLLLHGTTAKEIPINSIIRGPVD